MQNLPEVWVIPVFWVFGQQVNLGKMDPNTADRVEEDMKCNVTQSLLVHISHQARPYFGVRVVYDSRCTCLPGVEVFWQFRETGPKYPKPYVRTQKNNPKSPAPQSILNGPLLLWRIKVKVQLYLFYAGLINTWRTWRIESFWEKWRRTCRSHGENLKY